MTHGLFACAAFALLAITAQPKPSNTEAVHLAWQLEVGASYHIDSEVSTETETTTDGDVKFETQVVKTLHRVTVEEVTEEGNMLLVITLDKYWMSKESDLINIELEALRDDDGEITLRSTIESPIPELTSVEMEELFDAIGKNNLEMEYTFLITPTGEILESTIDGDPMGNLPTETEMTKMVAQTASSMIVVDDLPAVLASSIFIQLPEEELEEGGQWESFVNFTAAGVEMDGTGACTIAIIEQSDSTRSADIYIEMDYTLDVDKLIDLTIGVMENMFETMGVELSIDVLMSAEDINVEMNAEFDVTEGFLRSIEYSNMATTVEGTITVGDNDVELQVESLGTGYAVWSRIEDDED